MDNIQWFPGHMAKARRLLEENLSLVDAVIEITDARAPLSARNPEFDRLLSTKPRIIAANKSDLSDDTSWDAWRKWYQAQGIDVIYIDSKNGKGIKNVLAALSRKMAAKTERREAKGVVNVTIKAMVVGIPNVGKSSFINRVAGKYVAQTGDKPGVTRGKQWLRASDNILLLDTPGLLWPKFDDQRIGKVLACAGSIKDDILNRTEIVGYLLEYIQKYYPECLKTKYKIEPSDEKGTDILEKIARKRGYIVRGGELDIERACAAILDDFRGGKIGRITLDRVPSVQD